MSESLYDRRCRRCRLSVESSSLPAAGGEMPPRRGRGKGSFQAAIMTARAKLRGQKKEAASSFQACPFAPIESILVAKVIIGERRRCGDIYLVAASVEKRGGPGMIQRQGNCCVGHVTWKSHGSTRNLRPLPAAANGLRGSSSWPGQLERLYVSTTRMTPNISESPQRERSRFLSGTT